ncbi:hypothetical protein BR93DRAFT_939259 [Coniochaeta sp. PMI_546]|nr:hypothetical protein BR93DRAFT_939259 [Coniochaeta sp. PMI_546]
MPSLANNGGKATDSRTPSSPAAPFHAVEDHAAEHISHSGDRDGTALSPLQKFVATGTANLDRSSDLEYLARCTNEMREFYEALVNEQDGALQTSLRLLQDQLKSWRQGFQAYKTKREDHHNVPQPFDNTKKPLLSATGMPLMTAKESYVDAHVIDIPGLEEVHEKGEVHLRMVAPPQKGLCHLLFRGETLREPGSGCRYWRLHSAEPVHKPKNHDIVIQFSPGNLKLLIQAYYHLRNRKAELLCQWELANFAKFDYLGPPESHEAEPNRSTRFHELRKINIPKTLVVDKPVFGRSWRVANVRDSITFVEKRLLLLRGLPTQTTRGLVYKDNSYIDVASGVAVKKIKGDVVVEETEETYESFAKIFEMVHEEDLVEKEGTKE